MAAFIEADLAALRPANKGALSRPASAEECENHAPAGETTLDRLALPASMRHAAQVVRLVDGARGLENKGKLCFAEAM